MGNNASILFGGGPQRDYEPGATLAGNGDHSGAGTKQESLQQTAQARAPAEAEAADYPRLFGQGQSEVKSSRRSVDAKTPELASFTSGGDAFEKPSQANGIASRTKDVSTPAKKKHRPNADAAPADATDEGEDSTTDDAEIDSAPASPVRKGYSNAKVAAATMTEGGHKQHIVKVATAKIRDLEKERLQAGVAVAGQTGSIAQATSTAVVTTTVMSTSIASADAKTSRAVAESALMASARPASSDLLASCGAGRLDGGSPAVLGGVPTMPPKHINPPPAPQPNYRTKV